MRKYNGKYIWKFIGQRRHCRLQTFATGGKLLRVELAKRNIYIQIYDNIEYRILTKMGDQLETYIEVKLEKTPTGFNFPERVLGDGGENLDYIKGETGAIIQSQLKGVNKSVVGLTIRHQNRDGLKKTEDLIHSLISTVREDYKDFLADQAPFIRNRYKMEDLKSNQKYFCRPKCDMTFDSSQAYENHLSSQWHQLNQNNNTKLVQSTGFSTAQVERKEFVGTVTTVKGNIVIVSDSIMCDTRILPGSVKFQIGDKVKGVQIPMTHPMYKWKAVSLSLMSINKNLPSLLGDAPLGRPFGGVVNSNRIQQFKSKLLNAFSFFLNEQTTPKTLWNTHHLVQKLAKSRQIQRSQLGQSPTFCMLCNQAVVPAAMMPSHLGSASHRIKYVEKQLELGLEKFPLVYGSVPLPGVVTNNGKRLAVDAVTQFFGFDLPSHNADAFKSMILLNGALQNLYCEICQHSSGRFDNWIQHIVGKQHATRCVQTMASRGLHTYMQQYASSPAPAPKKMKEAIKEMANLLKTTRTEYRIETENIPDMGVITEQPSQKAEKPGLLGNAPGGRAATGFQGGPGPKPLVGFQGGPGGGNKRGWQQSNDFFPNKKARSGLLGAAPAGFNKLDDGGEWKGGFGSSSSEWDAPPGFKTQGSGDGFGWNTLDDDGGEYVGGFGSGNGNTPGAGGAQQRLLNVDTEREWDSPGEFVGGGGDDSFVGGGDPNFLPAGVNRDAAANILQAARGLMNTVQGGNMPGPMGFRGAQGNPEMVAVHLLSDNIRQLIATLQNPQMMQPQMLMSRLTPQDTHFLGQLKSQTGILNTRLLIRLVQTVRSLPDNVYHTLSTLNPQVLLNRLGATVPQEKMLVSQILTLLNVDMGTRHQGMGNLRPGLLGDRPISMLRRPLGGGLAGRSLLDMPVTFGC